MNRQQFFNTVKYMRLKPTVSDGRIKFFGNSSLYEARKALDGLPEVEVELILKAAVHNPDLLDAIKERASIRWSDGLSDTLYNAVLCNIKPLNEHVEIGEYGIPILKPKTDWDAELLKYRK